MIIRQIFHSSMFHVYMWILYYKIRRIKYIRTTVIDPFMDDHLVGYIDILEVEL